MSSYLTLYTIGDPSSRMTPGARQSHGGCLAQATGLNGPSQRQHGGEGRAGARSVALDRDASAVGLDDAVTDEQPQPRPAELCTVG
jgi:hypothetical protein